ncbi:SanA/YdcF family protein [Cochleicola gelatinilyticus]|nr:ElyC/SanA/YdcF family protein [Cochleicola gelatinilyticus]
MKTLLIKRLRTKISHSLQIALLIIEWMAVQIQLYWRTHYTSKQKHRLGYFALAVIWLSKMGLYVLLISKLVITQTAVHETFNDIDSIPENKVGVLLGTGKYLKSGTISKYYTHRIEAAVALFKAGKIKVILVSGDHGVAGYNEPQYFKEDLMRLGIPENKIVLDYAGFRTLDSVVRAKKVFGLKKYTIISQKWHNQRAIYLAKNYGLEVIGYNSKDVNGVFPLTINSREYAARTKAILDILFHKKPKFLGSKIEIL